MDLYKFKAILYTYGVPGQSDLHREMLAQQGNKQATTKPLRKHGFNSDSQSEGAGHCDGGRCGTGA